MLFTLIIGLIVLISGIIKNSDINIKYRLISPSVLTSAFILIYCVLGVHLYWGGDYFFLNHDFEPTINNTYIIISLFLTVFFFTELITYKFIKIKKNDINYVSTSNFTNLYTLIILFFGLILLKIGPGTALSGVLSLFFNTLIPIIGYHVMRRDKLFYLYLIFFTFLSIMLGFRYRLILLYIPIILTFFIRTRVLSIKFLILSIGLALFFALVATVGVTRVYSVGLNFDNLNGLDFLHILIHGLFNDTNTVLATGAFIDYIDNIADFAHFNQLIYLFEYFIPSFFLEQKNYSPILQHVGVAIGDFKSGIAVLGFAEFYHTGGFFAVTLFSLMYSYIFTRLYKKQIILNNLYYSFLYLSLIGWLLNSYTRGYLPQNYADLISTIIGLHVVKNSLIKSTTK